MDLIKQRKEVRTLDCLLEQEEISKKAEDMAHAVQEKNRIQLEKKEAVSGYKKDIEEQEKIIQTCSYAINNGKEQREVECKVELNNPSNGTKLITRLDTGEYWEEKMTDEELQENLEFVK